MRHRIPTGGRPEPAGVTDDTTSSENRPAATVRQSAPEGGSAADGPTGYTPIDEARRSLPEPTAVQVDGNRALETLFVEGTRPAVVFVHGGLGSLWNPYPQLAALAGERAVVAYSLAGNRGSATPDSQSLAGHVGDLTRLLERLDVGRPIVHGHSYGSAIALEYAKRTEVAGVVLAGGGDHDLAAWWEPLVVPAIRTMRLYRLPTAVRRRLAQPVTRASTHPETPQTVVTEFARSNPLPGRRSAWETPGSIRGYDGRGDLDRIDAPVLVRHGVADDVVPVELARGTAERLPDATFERVHGTGHLPFVERPGAYTDRLRAFAKTVSG